MARKRRRCVSDMIKAAIVGLGWWGRTIQRELAASSDHPAGARRRSSATQARAAAAAAGLETTARFEDALARAISKP